MFSGLSVASLRGWVGALALVGLIALVLIETTGNGRVAAALATPTAITPTTASIVDASGAEIGTATFSAVGDGRETRIEVSVHGLPAGQHGLHIHETGSCDPSGEKAYSSAGGHFNPDHTMHGAPILATPGATPAPGTAHAGDLGNITVGADGTGTLTVVTSAVTLLPGAANSLNDADGSAIVLHAGRDDLVTDPSGESGGRMACGVIFP